MRISRDFDKVFSIRISEKEAELVCGCSTFTFERSKEVVTRMGQGLLSFMHDSCIAPHSVKPSLEVEL